jgi:hypothetical protein
LVLGACLPAFAKPGGLFRMEIEPVVGYERVQKLIPTPHQHDRLLYGARLTVGVIWVAAEAEYLNSTDNESFAAEGLATKDVTDRAKVGLRVNMNLARILAFTLRGGCQATRNRHTETSGGVTTVNPYEPITYRPYLGAGFTATLARNFALRADMTAVFEDFPSFKDAQYQATAGLVVRFP